ncbi:hypothetical protein F5Y14DRAFT_342612 [Nemania sp. NC0429]|nr:hypothetical protein F5Y14DRAFT_342612 [Nemania sp. NC0429]
MQFATFLALALPLVAAMPQATPTTSSAAPSATPSGTPDLLAVCQSQAGGYWEACPQCLHNCATTPYPAECFWSVFSYVNGVQSNCQMHGGGDECLDLALNLVCGEQ